MTQQFYGYCDFETTGLRPSAHAPLEFTIRIMDQTLATIAEYSSGDIAIEAADTITPKALECNKFTLDRIAKGRSRHFVLAEFIDFLRTHKVVNCIMIGHNVSFDYGFMEKMFGYNEALFQAYFTHRKIDVQGLCLVRNILQGTPLASTSLVSECKRYNISNAGAHTSAADVDRGMQVYHAVMNELFLAKVNS